MREVVRDSAVRLPDIESAKFIFVNMLSISVFE